MTHTSGMIGSGPQDRRPDDTLATVVPRYAAFPLRFQPGTDWEYSGIAGPDVLARIAHIPVTLGEILEKAAIDSVPTNVVADRMAQACLARAQSRHVQRVIPMVHALS